MRAVLHLSATYPDGSVGWVVDIMGGDMTPQEFIGGRFPSELFLYAIDHITGMYHSQVGPAYSPEDFTYTIWFFETSEEMFHTCGMRLLATDGLVAEYAAPSIVGPKNY